MYVFRMLLYLFVFWSHLDDGRRWNQAKVWLMFFLQAKVVTMFFPAEKKSTSEIEPVQLEKYKDKTGSLGSSPEYRTLECRSFWRAASNNTVPSSDQFLHDRLVNSDFEHARVHPRFLHSNATSHKWAFGAIAELLDNSVDEIAHGATFIKVDRVFNPRNVSPMLLFQDNGGGMDPGGIRKCMSLGFSSKTSNKTIGQYGNGFKTSTMRLGADAIVFSRSICDGRATESIGFLSYTFLTRTMKNDTVVPMIDFEIVKGRRVPIIYSSKSEWDDNLKTILEWSPFSSESVLMDQFSDIGNKGTKIFVYNLWYDDEGHLELDFDDDPEDIRLRDREKAQNVSSDCRDVVESHVSYTHKYSLQAYASILYLKRFTTFSIVLRGKPVQQFFVSTDLKFTKGVKYCPYVGRDDAVKIIIGFTKEAPILGTYGINVYHKNRLIKPFWKVFQESSNRGKCVVGVLEANFMEPAHDKQDFERTTLSIRLETRLKRIVTEYWKNHCHLLGYKSPYGPQTSEAGEAVEGASSSVPPAVPINVNLENEEPTIRETAGRDTSANQTSVQTIDPDCVVLSCQSDDVSEGTVSAGKLDPDLVQKLSEENIMLYAKREEYRFKEVELMQVIEELEREVEETKTKCTKLALDIEIRKKHKALTNQM